MDPVTASIVIDRPREEVFDYLADIANHAEFSDHYLTDWRLTRIDSYGRGAGARFKIDAPLDRYAWGDMTFIEVERPYRILAAGRSGKFNR
ncbi:MAG TPA: SRPBCC family protein, partial [Gemmatimonadales bacterium]|nr:SRPBCC family protein [Gemmatimonadales bacterium]